MVKEPRFGRLFSWNTSKIETCITSGNEQQRKHEYTNGEHLFKKDKKKEKPEEIILKKLLNLIFMNYKRRDIL